MKQSANVFFALALLSASRAIASVPPDYKEPARAEMKKLGFKYRLSKNATGSSIDLHFPKSVRTGRFTLVPHSTDVIVNDLAGVEISRSTNWVADSDFRSVLSSYNHKVADVSVSVTYACGKTGDSECYGAATFSIPSVSKFIDANPDIVNLRPICRNITRLIIDCTKYASDEYP